MTRSNSLSGAGPSRPTIRFAGPMPAQLTRIRAGPLTLAADPSAAVTSSGEATSHGAASPPIAPATFRAACSFTSSTATLAPAAARARAVAAPSPEAAPVTIAACPLMSIAQLLRSTLVRRVFDQQRDALAAADAGRCDAVTATGTLELARQRQRQADAGGTERMPDRDGAAIDVELALVKPKRADARHHLRAKRFVDLEAVDIGQLEACKVKHRADRRHRTDAHDIGWNPDGGSGQDARQSGLLIAFGIILRADQHGCGAIDDGGGVPSGLDAAEGRLECGQYLDRRGTHMSVGRELGILQLDAAPVEAIHRKRFRLHGSDFAGQEAACLRRECALEAL